LNLTFATLDRRPFRTKKLNHGSGKLKIRGRNQLLFGSTLTMVFLCVGYVVGQPLRIQSVFASVATVYRQALEMKSSKPLPAENATGLDPAGFAQPAASRVEHSISRVRAALPQPTLLPDQIPEPPAETLRADALAIPSRILIPESLREPAPETAVRTASLTRPASVLSQVEPVGLPEDLSQSLLLDKVQPSYPEQAVKAGLQGAVVLQAWIDKDGNVRDLKLVDGSLLLGKAAVKAVKQWRYRPYLLNGVAVDAETYVTVNFRLP
jgi:TonB family protein